MKLLDQTEQARKAFRRKKVLNAPVGHGLALHSNHSGLFYNTDVGASPFDILVRSGLSSGICIL